MQKQLSKLFEIILSTLNCSELLSWLQLANGSNAQACSQAMHRIRGFVALRLALEYLVALLNL